MSEYTAEEVRALYEKRIGDSDMPRWGSFGREMVKPLLDRIDELEDEVSTLRLGKAFDPEKSRAHSERARRKSVRKAAKDYAEGTTPEVPPSRQSHSIEEVLSDDDKRAFTVEGEIGEENDR